MSRIDEHLKNNANANSESQFKDVYKRQVLSPLSESLQPEMFTGLVPSLKISSQSLYSPLSGSAIVEELEAWSSLSRT